MWWLFFILFLFTSIISSVILYYSLKRLDLYEDFLAEFQRVIDNSSIRLKLIDDKDLFKSDDEIGFMFDEIKEIQNLLDELFEPIKTIKDVNIDKEKNKTKKEKEKKK